jgi:hypothetical protein
MEKNEIHTSCKPRSTVVSFQQTCSSATAINNHNTIKNPVVVFYDTNKEWTRPLSDLRRLVSIIQKKGTMFCGRHEEEEEETKWDFWRTEKSYTIIRR